MLTPRPMRLACAKGSAASAALSGATDSHSKASAAAADLKIGMGEV